MYVSKEGYTRFFFLFGDEKERSVLRVAMLLCSEKKNEIDFGQLHLIPHPLLLSRSLARSLSLCLSISLSLSLSILPLVLANATTMQLLDTLHNLDVLACFM